MDEDYKTSKEAFVSGMKGSTIGHINMVSLVALSSIALHSALRTRLPARSAPLNYPTEFLILVLPLLLSVTIFANSPGLLNTFLLVPTAVLSLVPRTENGTVLPSIGSLSPSRSGSPVRETAGAVGESRNAPNANSNASAVGSGNARVKTVPIAPLPALTTYRSHMLLLTFICILAVDFPIFPREMAKCETFGVSIMDLGVGSFVFSQGLVSSIPILKNPTYLTRPLPGKLWTVVKKCAPLWALGLLRVLSVKGMEYPEHQSEYGTHWNFFLTLGVLPVLQVFLHPLMVHLPISLVGVIAGVAQQIVLSSGGLTSYVLNAPRTSIISHNKEGLVSLLGYLSIHLLGLSTGTLLLPPSPSYFRRIQHQLAFPSASSTPPSRPHPSTSDSDSSDSEVSADIRTSESHTALNRLSPNVEVTPPSPGASIATATRSGSRRRGARIIDRRENDKTAIELCSYAVVWWALLGLEKWFGVGGGISRRLVTLQYITWTAAYNTSFLLGYLILDLIFFPSPLSKSVYSPTSKLKVHPDPVLLRRSNSSGGTSSGSASGIGGSSTNARAEGVSGSAEGGAPLLLDAVNKNGLVLFLLANIVTGLINLSIPTMYMSDPWAMIILVVYAISITAVAWVFRGRKLWRF